MEAQKHYFGVLYDGELVARGIKLRRHDTPAHKGIVNNWITYKKMDEEKK